MTLEFLNGPATEVAPRLLGCELEWEIGGKKVRVRIVETESYDQDDAASHSYKGRTPRTDVMFGPSGHLYVYFTYGMHYCCNVVCGPEGRGEAVLIRAVEPIDGAEVLEERRGKPGIEATNGPAKLCQALGIDRAMNGHDLSRPPLVLIERPPLPDGEVLRTPRVGISKAKDELRRYYVRSSRYVSKS